MTQGAHAFHVAVKRNLQQLGQSEPWTVIIDRRPPSFPSSFMVTASLESSSRTAIIDWDAAGDPTPQDGGGEPGPATGYRVRYRHPGGTFSAWQDTALERVEIPNSFAGDLFDLEIVPRDAAGNLGSVMAAQVRVEGEGTHCQATANGVPSDCFDDVEPGPNSDEAEPEDGITLVPVENQDGLSPLATPARRADIVVEPPGEWATIRRTGQSFVIGNARNGWQMDVVTEDDHSVGWDTGRIYGGFGTCGWIATKRVPAGGTTVETGCSVGFGPLRREFGDGFNCNEDENTGIKECGHATDVELRRNVTDVDFCLNVDPPPTQNIPVHCENKVPGRLTADKIRNGYTVGWRYTTRGVLGARGGFVLVSDGHHVDNSRHGRWGFIPRRALRRQLCTRRSADPKVLNCGPPP